MNLKKLNIFIIFYIVFILIAYKLTDFKLFNFLYYNIFDGSLNFIPESQNIKIKKYLYALDIDFLFFVPILPLLLYSFAIVLNFNKILFPKKNSIFFSGHDLDHLKRFNINYLIAVAAGLGLYLELAIIRTHSSFFQMFAFFKNFSLLSCLLGLGIGYLFGNRKLYSLKWVFPIICTQILLMFFLQNTPLSLFIQNPITEQFSMGQGFAQGFFQFFVIYSFIVLIFVFNAMAFIPLGHLVSKLMFANKKLLSYSYNLLGSIGGIIIFALLSLYWTGPALWFFIGFLFLLFFQKKEKLNLIFSSVSILIILMVFLAPKDAKVNGKYVGPKEEIYSPYQIISVIFKNNSISAFNFSARVRR